MDLDRGVLARIDRRLLAGLSQDATFHMVRVPATEAKWATWKRYCEAAGLSMGRAIVALIDRELVSVFGEIGDGEIPVFAAETQEELTRREAAVTDREDRLGGEEQRLREWVSAFASGSRSCRDANSRPSSLRNSLRGLERRARGSVATSDARAAQGSSTSAATTSRTLPGETTVDDRAIGPRSPGLPTEPCPVTANSVGKQRSDLRFRSCKQGMCTMPRWTRPVADPR